MLTMNLNRLRAALLATTVALGAAPLAMAQDSAPALTPAADYAGAVIRQDMFKGVYELVDDAEAGVLYVASTPDFKESSVGYVHVLNRDDLSEIRRIQVPRGAFALSLDRDADTLYVGNTTSGSLSVIDTRGGVLTRTIQLGKAKEEGRFEHTRMVEVDPASKRVFVTSPSETGAIWIVDTANGDKVQRLDDAGMWLAGLVRDPEDGRFYVSGAGIEEIGVYDEKSGERLSAIATGDTTEKGPEASQHFFVNVAMDTAGNRLFAADAKTGQIYVLDAETGKTVTTIPVGMGALDVIYNPARNELYATWRGASREKPEGTGGLAIIDASDYSVVKNLDLPVHPNSLELSEDGAVLFATVKAPLGDKHPAYRSGIVGSVLRVDLPALVAQAN